MRCPTLRIRYAICAGALMLLTVPVFVSSAAVAAKPAHFSSADLRYPFMRGGPKNFGVFGLQITGGTCSTAHTVAKEWMKRFEANLRAGHVKLPRSVSGFTFTTLPAKAAQTYRERGTKRATTIRFDYRVPNG